MNFYKSAQLAPMLLLLVLAASIPGYSARPASSTTRQQVDMQADAQVFCYNQSSAKIAESQLVEEARKLSSYPATIFRESHLFWRSRRLRRCSEYLGNDYCPVERVVDIDMKREPALLVHTRCLCPAGSGNLTHWARFRSDDLFKRDLEAQRQWRCVQRSRSRVVLKQAGGGPMQEELGSRKALLCAEGQGSPVAYRMAEVKQDYTCDLVTGIYA